jgi:2-dehydropantoate 2-reductase
VALAAIIVIGPGAVGGTIAAWLIDAGHDVTLAVRTAFDHLRVETDDRTLESRPGIIRNPAEIAGADWALVATKTYNVISAAEWLRPLMSGDARVAVLQNGVEHLTRFSPHFPPDRLLPVMVDVPAERDAPGLVRQRGKGHVQVPKGPDGQAFVDLFQGSALEVQQVEDFTTALWRKLCINVAGAVSVLADETAIISWREPAAEVMRALVRECAAVARAEGARLDDSVVNAVLNHYRNSPPDSLNSMHADRRAGRPMEWDARNGVVSRLGRKHQIATPVSDTVSALLAAIDERALR